MTNHTPLTDQQLADIEARAAAATDGPWCTDSWEIYQGAEYEPGISTWIGETCRGATTLDQDRADAAFVAAARTDVPALLAEVRRLRAGMASERPTEDHDGVYVDEQGFLYGEYQAAPRTDEVYLLRLQWVDEMAVAKSELEQQGAVFQHLGWCL